MWPPRSYLTLGIVALVPPDKMGSTMGVLAKAGQKDPMPGLYSRAGVVGAVAVLGAEAACVCSWERFHENP